MAIEAEVMKIDVEVRIVPLLNEGDTYVYYALDRARALVATSDRNQEPLLVLLSISRYSETILKFQNQQRFYPSVFGGLNWDGALVFPSAQIDDLHIGFVAMPPGLKVLYP